MNFTIDPSAIKAAEGENIEELIAVNNLDVLLDAKKGFYNFSGRDEETKFKDADLKDTDLEDNSPGVLTADISSAFNKKQVIPLSGGGEKEPIKTTIERINPEQLSQLRISDWQDVTSVKIIRDGSGSPETIKIKNKKGAFGDKSRTIRKGEDGWEAALVLAKVDSKREDEEQQSELAKR